MATRALSPVMLDSSNINEYPSMNSPSAETEATRKTATSMLPPSYQPSLCPSFLMPNPSNRAAQTKRITIVVSLKASHMKLKKLLISFQRSCYSLNASKVS